MKQLSVDHLTGIVDLTRQDIELILETAARFKEVINRPIKKVPSLRDITIANVFFENSTRTRLSFELAQKRLSADVVNFSAAGSSVKKGETLVDTVNNIWWAFYAGITTGGETWLTSVNLYCKGSSDGGTTWGPETLLTTAPLDITWLATVPRLLFGCPCPPPVAFHNDIALDELKINVGLPQRRASVSLGV
jgi:hypothetical protein